MAVSFRFIFIKPLPSFRAAPGSPLHRRDLLPDKYRRPASSHVNALFLLNAHTDGYFAEIDPDSADAVRAENFDRFLIFNKL